MEQRGNKLKIGTIRLAKCTWSPLLSVKELIPTTAATKTESTKERHGSKVKNSREKNTTFSREFYLKTSRTEFGQQMRSGDLPAYLSLNCFLNGIVSCSRCYFVRIQPISQKFNLCVTDRPTDRRTDKASYRDARTHQINIPYRTWHLKGFSPWACV